MRRHHAWCHRRFISDWRNRERAAKDALDDFACNAAGAKECRPLETGYDRRLDTDGARSGVDDEIDASPQIGEHMSSTGWRYVARAVRGWCHHGPAERREQGARDRMLWHTHRDTVEAGEREIGDAAIQLFRQH